MGNSNLFKMIGGVRPGKSVFDLSYEKKLTCDMGQLIPVMCDEVVPGDYWKIGNQAIIRFQPMVAPVLHQVDMYVHYYFVPYRLLWDEWEEFITGGVDGDDTTTIPTWEPSNRAIGSLWDYLGFPTGVDPDGAYPIDFPRRAYNFVYNEYYRDENLITEVALTNEAILSRAWEKDYFTSAMLWQQRGTAPALPIAGTAHAVFDGTVINGAGQAQLGIYRDNATSPYVYVPGTAQQTLDAGTNLKNFLGNNDIDLSVATTFDIADLRIAFQIQKWMERNARAGVRYTEFLRAHFGVSPRDDRLDRPEYIGGSKAPVIFSEVLQTSSTDLTSPQGNLAGHGIVASESFCGKYRAEEYGLIIGIMSIMPKPAYQQGINRQWLKESRYDFFFPEFANLSEQAITRAEIFASDVPAENATIFGYQGRYDEMRIKHNMVCGQMRDTFDYWHLGRIFTAAPELNETFINCVPSKRIFAVESDPGLIVQFGNLIKAFRPLPIIAEPGLIDHV